MVSKVRGDRGNDEGGNANPVGYEISMHADVGGDFTVPITNDLKLVEAIFERIFVICTGVTE